MSYLTLEAIKAAKILDENKINCEVIDLVSLKPLNTKNIIKSIKKTKRVLVLDSGFPFASIASEITSLISRKMFGNLKIAPEVMTMPDIPEPTSYYLTKNLYINHFKIIKKISKIFKKKIKFKKNIPIHNHDVPGEWFKGPF